MLPQRRKQIASHMTRAPRRHFPKHEKWVRGFACCVPGCEQGPIEFAHLRLGALNNGIGIKPPSWMGISLCSEHHRQAHLLGERSFQSMHGLDWKKLAAEFAAKSPDRLMLEEMRNG
jgi:hypothetical protein